MNVQRAGFTVASPGALTSVQDLGRPGHRALGVAAGGAADRHSAQIANLLVGNPVDAAVLEITMSGPRLQLDGPLRIALTGAETDARYGDVALPGWRPIDLGGRSELSIGTCRRGVRAYLAIAGGIDVPAVLGSRATDLRAGFGGLQGRALRSGDRLQCGATNALAAAHGAPVQEEIGIAHWWIDPAPDMDLLLPAVARILPGAAELQPQSSAELFASAWSVLPDSNRIGLRLQGPRLSLAHEWSLPSEPVLPGTVQLPPDGNPIVLLADCGSRGGYPRIGHVCAADLPRLAQLRPGETLRMAPTTLAECDARACATRQRLARIALAIEARNGQGGAVQRA